MKKLYLFLLFSTIALMLSAQTKINLTIDDRTMTATMVDNAATRELTALLSQGPISIEMDDYGGFEKVGALPQSLPTSNSQITTVPGDIMLYQGRNMVIFFGSNSWSYTRLGKIDGATTGGLREFLGNGNVTVVISLSNSAGIESVSIDKSTSDKVYDLKGNIITNRPLRPGIYIVNNHKVMVK